LRASPSRAMATKISPLAPQLVSDAPAVPGIKLATGAAGIKYQGRTDVLLVVMDQKTTVAGVFTQSKCPSAPVEWCREKLAHYKCPTSVGFRPSLARTATGKLQKYKLRADYWADRDRKVN